ncbi:MAG: protein translocase subunit SecF [Magnetococcales bacterium]|nr:protein translocase subunit SecF [Magnetococcales bacterium]
MELIEKEIKIDFVRRRFIAFGFSGLLLLISIGSLIFQGLNLGIDFAGGTLVQVRFDKPVSSQQVREALSPLNLGDVVVQDFGSPEELLIRVERRAQGLDRQNQLAVQVVEALKPLAGEDGQVDLRRVEFVGPQVGDELKEAGLLAMLLSMLAILIYVAVRFEFRFAIGAVVALLHDVILTMGFFSLLQKEFTLVVVAALLTVVGYSLNDTIVVFDRVREEMKRLKKQPMDKIVNVAVNRTLSRTLVTSLTTILVLVALLVFGGQVIHDFSLTLFFGVVVGTYSSIFVASSVVLLMKPPARNPDFDKMP